MKQSYKNIYTLITLLMVIGFDVSAVNANQEIHSFRDCDDICPEMVVVPAGNFIMGPSENVQSWFKKLGGSIKSAERELPAHPVKIDYSFAVGKYEVTKDEYARFIQETGYTPDKDSCFTYEKDDETGEHSRSLRENRDWQNPGYAQGGNHPVACVSWHDVKAYIKWLNEKTGQTYRLLSEAEWEYAARAGTTSYRYWGNDEENQMACEFANVKDQTPHPDGHVRDNSFHCFDGNSGSSSVGSYGANAFGLHDMLGNHNEWVEDCWNEGYEGAPADGAAWLSGDCDLRVLRSGSWYYNPNNIRSSARFRIFTFNRGTDFGFRLARDID